MDSGYCILLLSVLFFTIATYAILLSPFVPLTGIRFLDALANDSHYKYFAIFLIPTTSYFVIANWVGWQYYRNS
ncbi:hypothetical protein FB45DRAFT_1026721 [Roridomyces roridus]|uniref:Uncharacterized protein n=1 Tax=Roridomyces roridus TaxID=1738132 RepID=A0AAD7BWP1_9AGAR|nr:hypothetical protein FB45DRAFT_1026721 [Roridomyces roridus]